MVGKCRVCTDRASPFIVSLPDSPALNLRIDLHMPPWVWVEPFIFFFFFFFFVAIVGPDPWRHMQVDYDHFEVSMSGAMRAHRIREGSSAIAVLRNRRLNSESRFQRRREAAAFATLLWYRANQRGGSARGLGRGGPARLPSRLRRVREASLTVRCHSSGVVVELSLIIMFICVCRVLCYLFRITTRRVL